MDYHSPFAGSTDDDGKIKMPTEERFCGANSCEAGVESPYWGEHAARYEYVRSMVAGKAVLDIACGTGYGLGILKEDAKLVIGIDIDSQALEAAKGECGPGVAISYSDATNLPFDSQTFDFVTSFETLEHLHGRKEFLSELARVLRRDGKLVLSTPNANYTQPVNGKPSNPYHIFEYTPGELLTELEGYFRVEHLLGQTLDESIRIPPFEEAQLRLLKDVGTQAKLFGWKVLNKMPVTVRERLSKAIWNKPFYPMERDYRFSAASCEKAPVLVAVCVAKPGVVEKEISKRGSS